MDAGGVRETELSHSFSANTRGLNGGGWRIIDWNEHERRKSPQLLMSRRPEWFAVEPVCRSRLSTGGRNLKKPPFRSAGRHLGLRAAAFMNGGPQRSGRAPFGPADRSRSGGRFPPAAHGGGEQTPVVPFGCPLHALLGLLLRFFFFFAASKFERGSAGCRLCFFVLPIIRSPPTCFRPGRPARNSPPLPIDAI